MHAWANPRTKCDIVGNCLKSSNLKWTKNHTLYSTKLPKFLKIEFSISHETHFKHVFKIRGGGGGGGGG